MKKISEKSITDLEFDIVLEQAAARCATELGKSSLLKLRPHTSLSRVQIEIERVKEYNQSFTSEYNIPNHGFESIDKALDLLSIENSKIEIELFPTERAEATEGVGGGFGRTLNLLSC